MFYVTDTLRQNQMSVNCALFLYMIIRKTILHVFHADKQIAY